VTLSSDQFHERLIDYLYGELEGEELRAFEEHLRGSDEARRELAALQSSLRSAREGLARAVDEPPPARVRSAVLAAAAAQVRAAEPRRAARPTRVDEQGGFSRWLRAAWLVPSLGVAAAVAVVVFGKNGKNLESPSMYRDQHVAKPTAAAPEPSPAVPPPSAAASESGQAEHKATEPAADMRQAPAKANRSDRAGARSRDDEFARPPPAWNPKRAQPSRAQQERSARAPAASGAAREPYAEPEREAPRSTEEQAAVMQDKASSGLGAASVGQRADPRAVAAEKSERSTELDDLASARPAAPASSAAPAPASDARASPVSEMQRSRADANAARAPNDLVRRAAEHVAARRWQQAAADYRELLRRYPNDLRVAAWKKQLVFATQALRGAERDAR
jgi:hypothetical protein